MTDVQGPARTTYSERDVQRILARAAELEANGSFTVEDVRKIARDAGIDARALDVAMSEPVAALRAPGVVRRLVAPERE